MIENIYNERTHLATILRSSFSKKGVNFFSEKSNELQLGFMSYDTGHAIKPHKHNKIERQIFSTQEVLIIKKGKLKVNFFNDENSLISSYILFAGDVILLISGAHGFEVLEKVDFIEVKQGPYIEEQDKVRFDPIS
jgi:mannose-6-phosphate isomerase-like protein (cupin superfamily)